MKLVIDRRKWLRGEEAVKTNSGLRVKVGRKYKMCCLGFYSLACGLTPEQIRGHGYPYDALQDQGMDTPPDGMEWLVRDSGGAGLVNSKESGQLAFANDDSARTDSDREIFIAAVFAKHGVEVEFIN